MIINLKLLNQYISISNKKISDIVNSMFNMGIEVEKVINEIDYSKYVVGKILECKKHPKSKKLSICIVDVGKKNNLSIVCGAPNVANGKYVIVALIGATLPSNNVLIAKRDILGVQSYGMICSLPELNYPEKYLNEDDYNEIYTFEKYEELGSSALKKINLNSVCLDLTFTSNRFDLNGIYNLAYEMSLFYGIKCKEISINNNNPTIKNDLIVKNYSKNTIAYGYFLIKNLRTNISHPDIKKYLFYNNIKSHNAIVDLTNYIMLELNQPLHAYDLDYIGKELEIKEYDSKQTYELLSEDERCLKNITVICNKKEPLCIAGICGLKNSGVYDNSKNILIEAAIWDPIYIRKAEKKILFNTQASKIYSHDLPICNVEKALKRFIYLAKKYKYIDSFSDIKYVKYEKSKDIVYLINQNDVNKICHNFDWNKFVAIARTIYNIKKKSSSEIIVNIPSYKLYIDCKNAVIESVLKIYGINNIQYEPVTFNMNKSNSYSNRKLNISKVENYLISSGFINVKSYNLIPKGDDELSISNSSNIFVKNPVSEEYCHYKKQNLFSLLNILNYNLDCQNIKDDFLFYEIYNRYFFKTSSSFNKEKWLSVLFLNSVVKSIEDKKNNLNFSYLFEILKTILKIYNVNVYDLVFQDHYISGFNKYNSVKILYGKNLIGIFGQIDNKYIHSKSNDDKGYYFELNISMLQDIMKKHIIIPISKYNLIKNDISFIFQKNEKVNLFLIFYYIYKSSKFIYDVRLFDHYYNKITKTTSIGIRFYIEPEDKLNKSDIYNIFEKIIKTITSKYNCKIIETGLFKNKN